MSLEVYITSRHLQVEKVYLAPGDTTPIIGQNEQGAEIPLVHIVPKDFGGDIFFRDDLVHLPCLCSGSTQLQTEFSFEIGQKRFDIVAPFPDCQ